MPRKSLIILTFAALGSFGISFGLTFLLSSPPQPGPAGPQPGADGQNLPEGLQVAPIAKVSLDEKAIDELGRTMRRKIFQYDQKLRQLQERERRATITRDLLAEQAKDLESLKNEMGVQLQKLQAARQQLIETRTLVRHEEQDNLKRLAGTYEKMSSAKGSQILSEMVGNNQEEDAVRILYFMSDRAAAKLLADMTDVELAARLCERLKTIRLETVGQEG